MKALILIDVDDDTNFDVARADVLSKTPIGTIQYPNVRLKPIPKKIDINLNKEKAEEVFHKYYWGKDNWGILNFKKTVKYAFISGYKRCIEELILGEEQ